ncbi:MAG: HlyD family type I secretion periplasmic adaptor subunit, partial [Proteobacteria bacterium]|nr:HlyD family type I secretion periplasmic adaptor subunit [Pseudomonadota bacterium]
MTNTDNARELDRNTKVFFYLCAGFCISFFVWASFSPLDIVSDAVGEVIPSSRVKRIQHLEGGIVRKIVVREGDLVEVGQPLIELETTASDSTVEELNVRVSSLTAEIARLEAESRWFVVGVDAAAQEESADANATRSEDSGIEPLELP